MPKRVSSLKALPVVFARIRAGQLSDIPNFAPNKIHLFSDNDRYRLDEGYDLSSAHFDTRGLVPGKYEMKLELFKKVGEAMQRVDLDTAGVELYEITTPAPFTMEEIDSVEPAEERKLKKPVGIALHLFGYRLVVHVDNRVCYGTINWHADFHPAPARQFLDNGQHPSARLDRKQEEASRPPSERWKSAPFRRPWSETGGRRSQLPVNSGSTRIPSAGKYSVSALPNRHRTGRDGPGPSSRERDQ